MMMLVSARVVQGGFRRGRHPQFCILFLMILFALFLISGCGYNYKVSFNSSSDPDCVLRCSQIMKGAWCSGASPFFDHAGNCDCVLFDCFQNVKYGAGFKSYFLEGTASLKAYKMVDYDDYKYWSDHEWGHYLFEYKLKVSDFRTWIKIVNNCTFESSYAKTYKSRGLRLEEEFADSFASVMNNKMICPLKVDFVRRFS